MKKILSIFTVLLLAITLISCDQRINHDVKVSFKDLSATSNSVDFNLEVKDESKELTGKIFVSIREDKAKKDKETKEFELKETKSDDEDELIKVTFSNLEKGKKYFIYVRGTIKEKSVLLSKEPHSFTTETPKDIDINTISDFYKINDKLNYNYHLKADLDFVNEDIETIDKNVIKTFTGNFYGNGHTIKNYKTTKSNTSIGLFGQLSKDAIVQDLKLDNIEINIDSTITGSRYAGILFGQANSSTVKVDNITITNSKINLPNVNGNSNYVKVGLLGGVSTSNITNINIEGSNEINISQRRVGTIRVGGLLGHREKTDSKLENIFVDGVINYSLKQYTEKTDSNDNVTYTYEGLRGNSTTEIYVSGFIGDTEQTAITNVVSKVDLNVKDLEFKIESESQLDDKNNKNDLNISIKVGGLFAHVASPKSLDNLAYAGNITVDEPSIVNQVKEDEAIKELNYKYLLILRVGSLVGHAKVYSNNLNNVYRVGGSLNIFDINQVEDKDYLTLFAGTLFGRATNVTYNETNKFGVIGIINDTNSVVSNEAIKQYDNLLDVLTEEDFIYKKLK